MFDNKRESQIPKELYDKKIPYSSISNPYKATIPCGKDFFDSWIRLQLDGCVENEFLHIQNIEKLFSRCDVAYRFSRPPLPSSVSAEYRIYGTIVGLRFEPTHCMKIHQGNIRTWFDIESFFPVAEGTIAEIQLTPKEFTRMMVVQQQAHSIYAPLEKKKGEYGSAWEIEFSLNNDTPARVVWEIDYGDNMKESSRIEIASDEEENPELFKGLFALLDQADTKSTRM